MSKQSTERRYTDPVDRAHQANSGRGSSYLKMPDGVEFFKPKAGINLIDVMPFVAGQGNPWAEEGFLHWERTVYIHRNVGPNQDWYVCPARSANLPCPICEFVAAAEKKAQGDEERLKELKELNAKRRQIMKVIDVKDETKGVQVWDISYFLFGEEMDKRLRAADPEDGWNKFYRTKSGLTLKVAMEEESFGSNSFLKTTSIDFRPRRVDRSDYDLEDFSLDDLVTIEPYAKLKKLFLQTAGNAEEEDSAEEDAPPAKSKKPAKPAAAEEDDWGEDAPPARKPAKPAKPAAAEEDDWGEDAPPAGKPAKPAKPAVEEDEEDAPPAKSKKPAKPAAAEEDDWGDFDAPPAKGKKPAAADDGEDDDAPPARKPAKPAKPAVEEDEDDAPPARKPAKPTKPAAAEEDEDPPRVRSGYPAEEDEDAPPARKPKKPAKPAAAEEDWD